MVRLPTPGHDAGKWGDILNEYLSQAHKTDGTLKDNVVGSSQLQDGVIASAKLSAALQDSVTKADTAVQPGDLGTSASRNIGTGPGTVAAGDDARIVGAQSAAGLDDAVAGRIADTGSETRAALSSTIKTTIGRPTGFGRKWIFVGDSLTDGVGVTSFDRSYVARTIDLAGGDVCRRDSIESGVAGETSTQIAARFHYALGSSAEAVVLLAGTNDVPGTQGSVATTIASTTANLTAMTEAARLAGKPMVICTIPPRTSATDPKNRQYIAALNLWILLNAPRLGCEVADHYAAVVDTTNGAYEPAYSTDGVHYNNLGALKVAQVTAEAMRRCFPTVRPKIAPAAITDVSLIADILNTRANVTTSPWTQVAATITPNYSMLADSSGFLQAGRWAQIQAAGGSGSGGLVAVDCPNITIASGAYTTGDKLVVVGQAQVEVLSGDWDALVAADTGHIRFRVLDSSSAELAVLKTGGRPGDGGIYDIGPFVLPFTISGSPGYFTVRTYLTLPGAVNIEVKLRWGCLTVLNLTKLGVASLAPSDAIIRV